MPPSWADQPAPACNTTLDAVSPAAGMVIKGWLLCAKASPGRQRQTSLNRVGTDNSQFCCGAATDRLGAARTGDANSDVRHCVAIIYIASCARLIRAGGVKHLNFGNYSTSQSRARARRSRRNCAFRLSSRSTLCHFGSIGSLRKFCFLRACRMIPVDASARPLPAFGGWDGGLPGSESGGRQIGQALAAGLWLSTARRDLKICQKSFDFEHSCFPQKGKEENGAE